MIVYRTKVEKSYMKTFNKDLTEFPKQERGKRWEGKPRIPDILVSVFLRLRHTSHTNPTL